MGAQLDCAGEDLRMNSTVCIDEMDPSTVMPGTRRSRRRTLPFLCGYPFRLRPIYGPNGKCTGAQSSLPRDGRRHPHTATSTAKAHGYLFGRRRAASAAQNPRQLPARFQQPKACDGTPDVCGMLLTISGFNMGFPDVKLPLPRQHRLHSRKHTQDGHNGGTAVHRAISCFGTAGAHRRGCGGMARRSDESAPNGTALETIPLIVLSSPL